MFLLILALAPGIAICLYMYAKDKFNREPASNLIRCFFLGALSGLMALVIESLAEPALGRFIAKGSFQYTVVLAFIVVALTEEGCKYLMLKRYAYRKPEFDEPFDGIIYCVMVGMGFATLENIGYVYDNGIATGILRMFLSVPAHASFAVLMGYYAGMAKFNKVNEGALLLKGFLLAVLFHGMFDCLLFLSEDKKITEFVSGGLLTLGALASYYFAIRLSLKAIRTHQNSSKEIYEQNKRNNDSAGNYQ